MTTKPVVTAQDIAAAIGAYSLLSHRERSDKFADTIGRDQYNVNTLAAEIASARADGRLRALEQIKRAIDEFGEDVHACAAIIGEIVGESLHAQALATARATGERARDAALGRPRPPAWNPNPIPRLAALLHLSYAEEMTDDVRDQIREHASKLKDDFDAYVASRTELADATAALAAARAEGRAEVVKRVRLDRFRRELVDLHTTLHTLHAELDAIECEAAAGAGATLTGEKGE